MSERHAPAWFVRWYMGRVAGRYCPCEWPIKSRRLIRLCGWIDDEYDRLSFIDFAAFHLQLVETRVDSDEWWRAGGAA